MSVEPRRLIDGLGSEVEGKGGINNDLRVFICPLPPAGCHLLNKVMKYKSKYKSGHGGRP